VIPVRVQDDIAYVRPNQTVDTITGLPNYLSGPGFAYGYNVVDNKFGAFGTDSILAVEFANGLLRWDGSGFQDAGATQLKAYRGSDPAVADPPTQFAVTSDAGPFDSVSLAPIASDYNAEAHQAIRFALLGDGSSLTSDSPDGVYLATMRVTSTQPHLAASDPYYFVLTKNAASDVVAAAVGSLGIAAGQVQYVPEPSMLTLAWLAAFVVVTQRRRR
jgi:hypothetical protein